MNIGGPFMKFKLFSLMIIFCIIVSFAVVLASANEVEVNKDDNAGSLDDFYDDIEKANGTLNMTKDYKYEPNDGPLIFFADKYVINGNGHKLDGSKKVRGFSFDNGSAHGKVVINNLTISNFSESCIGVNNYELELNNVVFINNNDSQYGGIVAATGSNKVTLKNCTFKYNSNSSDMFLVDTNLKVINSTFLGNNMPSIIHDRGALEIENCNFDNYRSDYGGILNYKGHFLSIENSRFSNSNASITGGAIVAKYFPKMVGEAPVPSDALMIKNCTFSNLSSASNGGSIYMDLDSGSEGIPQTFNVVGSDFINCSSKFGGALVNLGGTLNIENSSFADNSANSQGGAVYTSWSNLTIDDSSLSHNDAKSNAGAIYFDKGTLKIRNSSLTKNTVTASDFNTSNVIYTNDADYHFINSQFNDDAAIYTNFDSGREIKNINSTDTLSSDHKDYIVSVENKGLKLNIKNNSASSDKLPSKYDSRDFGWTSPVETQGDNFACWAFAAASTLESALLKSTGNLYNLSKNNIQDIQLKYNPVGDSRNNATGFAYSGLGYALSWNGVVSAQDDPYDERGMISEVPKTDNRIHLQDAMIIFGGQNDTQDSIKQAIMNYGAVSVQFAQTSSNYHYNDEVRQPTHFVSLVGWDDNIPAKKFKSENNKYPSKQGGWIFKDSDSGDNEDEAYWYISYCDKSFLAKDYHAIEPQYAAVAYIFENDIDYHVNYQTDLTGLAGFDGNCTYYSNEFTSKYDEEIGAVGTYFNDSGIDYSFDVYVNNHKVHSQSGVSEFAGFKTIVLDNYVPVKTGDNFKVVFKSNAVPYQAFSRQHYMPGMSLVSKDNNTWKDIAEQERTVCLKVYTVQTGGVNFFNFF